MSPYHSYFSGRQRGGQRAATSRRQTARLAPHNDLLIGQSQHQSPSPPRPLSCSLLRSKLRGTSCDHVTIIRFDFFYFCKSICVGSEIGGNANSQLVADSLPADSTHEACNNATSLSPGVALIHPTPTTSKSGKKSKCPCFLRSKPTGDHSSRANIFLLLVKIFRAYS